MSDIASRAGQIIAVWDAVWNNGRTDLLERTLADDYRRISADNAEGETREEFIASITATRAAFPDLHTEVDEVVVQGDTAAIRWHSVGTHEHSMMGVPPTHRRVEVSGATFSHFEGDQIVREYVTWDPRALLSALGIIHVGQD